MDGSVIRRQSLIPCLTVTLMKMWWLVWRTWRLSKWVYQDIRRLSPRDAYDHGTLLQMTRQLMKTVHGLLMHSRKFMLHLHNAMSDYASLWWWDNKCCKNISRCTSVKCSRSTWCWNNFKHNESPILMVKFIFYHLKIILFPVDLLTNFVYDVHGVHLPWNLDQHKICNRYSFIIPYLNHR